MRIPPTACRPSKNLLPLDHTAPSYQQWVTPELGLKSTQSKGNPRLGWDYRKLHNAIGRIPSKEPTYAHRSQTLIPHMPVPPREYTPSLFHSPSTTPLPFEGFSNRPDQQFPDLYSCYWTPSKRNHFPNNLSHLERYAHMPDNLLLQSMGLKICLFNSIGLKTYFFSPTVKSNSCRLR